MSSPSFEADAYDDVCSLCGAQQTFTRDRTEIRESYRCAQCKALLREREQARVLVALCGSRRHKSVNELCKDDEFRRLHVYEPGTSGPFRRHFQSLPHYYQSAFYGADERRPKSGIPHQNLEALTFDSAQFDVVLSSDILEHVRRPQLALRELHRVLRPGGLNLFTVPLQDPLPVKTVWRVDTGSDEDRFLLPPRYHGDGRGGRSLVYADYGNDLIDMLRQIGFNAEFVRPQTASRIANKIVTVTAIRAR